MSARADAIGGGVLCVAMLIILIVIALLGNGARNFSSDEAVWSVRNIPADMERNLPPLTIAKHGEVWEWQGRTKNGRLDAMRYVYVGKSEIGAKTQGLKRAEPEAVINYTSLVNFISETESARSDASEYRDVVKRYEGRQITLTGQLSSTSFDVKDNEGNYMIHVPCSNEYVHCDTSAADFDWNAHPNDIVEVTGVVGPLGKYTQTLERSTLKVLKRKH